MGTLCTQLRLSLTELDRRFSYLMEGRAYHGEAINPRGLSVWERLTRIGKVSLFPSARLLSLQRCCGLLFPLWMSGSATRTWLRLGAVLQ